MCGILGWFSSTGIKNHAAFDRALNLMYHRGPDHGAIAQLDHGLFGHRRLSIIDLSRDANQPFSVPDIEGLTIVFNGEIYNFKELGNNLENLRTKSDTEVILRGYAKHGTAFFHLLRGIYAFAIADYREKNQRKLILFRDPAGVKPLYFAKHNGAFILASEIKAIIPLSNKWSVHEDVIKAYLSIGYCPEPHTAYREIKALEPGHVLEVELPTLDLRKIPISSYQLHTITESSTELLIDKVDFLLKQSVKRNIISDVPVIFSLSGGIDSSLIVALASELGIRPDTLTVSFKDREYDEADIARVYAKQLELNPYFVSCDTTGSLDLLNKLVLHFDQPFADSSLIPFYFLSKTAKQYSRVLIGGDGGDEIHAGYSNFITLPRINRFKNFRPLTRMLSQLTGGNYKRRLTKLDHLLASKSEDELLYLRESWIYPDITIDGIKPFLFDHSSGFELYSSCFHESGSGFEKKLLADVFYRRMLGDYLRKADMMSMINSVEYRVPMLDEDLTTLSLSIPLSLKIENNRGKKILRALHSRYFPRKTSNLSKTGFSIPMDTWLSKSDFLTMQDFILQNGIVKDFVNENYIRLLFKTFFNKNHSFAVSRAGAYQQILILYALQLWYVEGVK